MGDMYDSTTVQVIDQEIDKLLHKSTAKRTRFSSFDDLFQNLAEDQPTPVVRTTNVRIKHEPISQMYLEEGAVPLSAESDDEEIIISNPIPNPVLDRQIKQENHNDEEKEVKFAIEGVFDQLYYAHIKTEEELEPSSNQYFDEQNQQPEDLNGNSEYDNSHIDGAHNTNIPTASQENKTTKDLASVNSQSNNDFSNDLDSHQIAAETTKIRLRSTPNNSNNNSMLFEERPSQQPDPIIDEPLIDLNGDNNDDKPANESQEVYITGMNIKKPIIRDIFNDDDDFQSPVKKQSTNIKKDTKKSLKNPAADPKSNNNVKTDNKTKRAKTVMEKPQTKLTLLTNQPRSEPTKASNDKKSAEKEPMMKNNKNVDNKEPKTLEKQSKKKDGSENNNNELISISRSKRRVVLENMNKKYTDETKIVDGYFPNKSDPAASIAVTKKSPKKKSDNNTKILQKWTLYCWGRKGFMHHIEFSVPLLKHRNLITYYKTLLNENRPRIQADKIRSSPPSHIHVLSLDMSAIAYVINLGDKLTLNKQAAFVNKKGIQYKGRLYKSIEEWSSACLKESSSPRVDLATLLSKIEVNNKGSFKQAMAKACPAIHIMKPHPFLKRNVSRFIEVARKRSGNKTLFSNFTSINWPPEEEPARYIYPMDYKDQPDLDLPLEEHKPKKRKLSASEASNERPKKKPKHRSEHITANHSHPYLTRRNEHSEPVTSVPKEKKDEEKRPKKKMKSIEEKSAQKAKESPIIKDKAVKTKEKSKEKPKEKPTKQKEVREKERESPILPRAEKSTTNRKETRVDKPKPVISIHKDHNAENKGTSNKNTNGKPKEADKDRASLRELVSAHNKKKKSTWLQNIKPVNNNSNNDMKASTEIPSSEPKINLTASSEKQIVIEDDDIYNEFFS